MGILTRMIPRRVKDSLKVFMGMAVATPPSAVREPQRFRCPVCNAVGVELQHLPIDLFRELNDHQHLYSFSQYETLNVEFYSCSNCGASDRDRLYALYFRRTLGTANVAVLEVAPVASLTRFIKTFPNVTVRTGDLFMANVDDRIDVMNMHQYKDSQFDVFLCSHVLEHVADDITAMKELYRVLKVGGWGITMVPIHLGLQAVVEDPSIKDEAGRWKHFGQSDHVRMYSKTGFLERLKSVGFSVEEVDRQTFGDDLWRTCGIHPRSVLYVVRKTVG